MRYLWISLFLLTACGAVLAADAPERPPCTALNEGRFWPEEANDNPRFIAALMPYGYPEVCTLRKGHYGWRSMTVSIGKLQQDADEKRAGKKREPAEQHGGPTQTNK
ncbi:MAG TPA: hypothetical protein VEU96_32275 [Bryobacteraceae bacterium]|nr:hypothetical protein [Bryobacteraceae bacterium]